MIYLNGFSSIFASLAGVNHDYLQKNTDTKFIYNSPVDNEIHIKGFDIRYFF